MKMVDKMSSEEVLNLIKPPVQVKSLAAFENLVDDTTRLTFIEMPYFDAFKNIAAQIKQENVMGDVVNVGIYRGGGSLYMKALFEELTMQKQWWLFDSFSGFNLSNITSPKEVLAHEWFNNYLRRTEAPTKAGVVSLFEAAGLNQLLTVVEGFIEETHVMFTSKNICLLHIDVDFYASTLNCLACFYDKVSEGGWIIVDDYNLPNTDCKEAVDDFRAKHHIKSPLKVLGNYQVGWQKRTLTV